MRVLMQTPAHGLTEGEVLVIGEQVCVSGLSFTEDGTATASKPRVEAISTDQHIQLLHQGLQSDQVEDQNAFNLIDNNAASREAARLAMRLLALPDAVKIRTLAQLSQGEQKLVLIARALAAPIEQHAGQRIHMVLITHHEEEITRCFSSIFEIHDKQLVERRSA
ncbi:unnamed protein product [Peronospora destructor]|uniref:ABC transporter domain-containing protein n=1 Tax=Peronospora destructor TaxID=86335 RepID=A0AAV0V3Q2_9STRA|nr:unnamed protein product [Peronospora destructor]